MYYKASSHCLLDIDTLVWKFLRKTKTLKYFLEIQSVFVDFYSGIMRYFSILA